MPRQVISKKEKARGDRLATTLREAREEAKRSREYVARKADLSVETIRRIEKLRVPNPGFFTVLAIAKALRIPTSKLQPTEKPDDR
jgi:transcriptional regulator with XRE-family HTH domain